MSSSVYEDIRGTVATRTYTDPPPLDEINGLDHVHLLGCDDMKAYCRTALLRKGYTKCKDEDFQKLHLAKCAFGEEKEIKHGDLNEYQYHKNLLRECAGAKLDSKSVGNLRMIELKSLISNRLTDAIGLTNAFMDACESGQVDVVELLLADVRVDPTTRTADGHKDVFHLRFKTDNVAIREAASNGHTEVVKLLLAWRGPNGEQVNPTTRENDAIQKAASNGHAEVVELLLADVRVDATDAIRKAAENGHAEVVKLLLAWRGPNGEQVAPWIMNNWAIHRAGADGHAEVVKLLLAWRGPDDKYVNPTIITDVVIRYAAENGHTEVVKLLLAWRGPNGEQVNPTAVDNAAIRNAAKNGHTEVVKLLIEDGRVDYATMDKALANLVIRMADSIGHAQVVRLLNTNVRLLNTNVDE